MEIYLLQALVCAVVSMVIGGIWYGPLFGKTWMRILNVTPEDVEARKKMQKSAGPLYIVQFLLTLFQAYVLVHFIEIWSVQNGGSIPYPIETALWIWAAFILPTIAGASMWTNDSSKVKWARFLIQTGYQLVLFVVFGLILHYWK